MCSGIDEQHTKDHGVPSNSTDFRVVNLVRSDRPKLSSLNVKKAKSWSAQVSICSALDNLLDIMTRHMNNSPP